MSGNQSQLRTLSALGIDQDTSFGSPMLPDFIRMRIHALMETRAQEAARIGTMEQWEQRRKTLRPRLLHSLGLAPVRERTPLIVRDVGFVDRDGFQVRKIVFEAHEGCPVPGHLYVPAGRNSPMPAVLVAVGHWIENGKMEPDLQRVCIGLAKLGFVALIYDPLEQGERRVDWHCHNHLEALLVGCSQAGLMVWESMRAIDYLQSLPEVDPRRIGMTGASGGGHNTMYVSALDERVMASVPVCYVNSFEALLASMRGYNWVGGQDLCNQVPQVMSYADMGDICALIAPRALKIVNATHDPMFPARGAEHAAERARHVFGLLDAQQKISLTLVEDEHGYSKAMREAAYGWFMKWLRADGDGSPIPEPRLRVAEPPHAVHYISATADPDQPKPIADRQASREMYCFDPGEPRSSWGAVTRMVLAKAESAKLATKVISSESEWQPLREQLAKSLFDIIGPVPERYPLSPGIVNVIQHGLVAEQSIRIESEPGITIPAVLWLKEEWRDSTPVVIYITDSGMRSGLLDGSIADLLQIGCGVLSLDLRGTGQVATPEFESATDSLMLDRSLFSQRLWDLLRAVDYMAGYSVIGTQIDKHRIGCVGRGVAGLLALYAGAYDSRIAAVGCLEAPCSYKDMIEEIARFPPSAYLFDVLNHFEIEQVAALISPRPVYIGGPLDGQMRPVAQSTAERKFSWCRGVYRALGAEPMLRVVADGSRPSAHQAARWFLTQWSRP